VIYSYNKSNEMH